jgi:hypothetical protein
MLHDIYTAVTKRLGVFIGPRGSNGTAKKLDFWKTDSAAWLLVGSREIVIDLPLIAK